MVAHKLIRQLESLGALDAYAVTVIGEEPYPAYSRVHLTRWLDHRDWQQLALERPGWDRTLGIRAMTNTTVVSIDRNSRLLHTAGGEVIAYDRLVLATGSAPFVPAMEGAQLEGVFVYRTIDDLNKIGEHAARAGSAVVLGGGLLGLEAADALRRLGLEVHLLETGPRLMRRQLDSRASELLEAHIRETGVHAVLGARPRRIEARGHQLALLADHLDQPLVADMIVFAAGIRPRDELARDSGLEVAPGRGGVVIDDQMRTSDPAIFAIGECASHQGVVYGLVAPGFRMAETLARVLAGRRGRFHGYVPAARLRLMGINAWSLGDPAQPGTCIRWSDQGVCRQAVLQGKRMVAASSVGPCEEIGFMQDAILHQRYIEPYQVQRFLKTGRFLKHAAGAAVADWPASAMVCNCLEITKGTLSARARDCTSVQALAERTGASTVCGTCRPLLSELIGEASPPPASRHWGLFAVAGVAAVLLLLIVAGSPIPPAASVRDSGVWDVLYRDGGWRQVTGFGLLGCVLVATLGFSLRKRWQRIEWGKVEAWRLAHSAIATAALALLVTHTGFRLGSGFNQVLMLFFLAACMFGIAAVAGVDRRHAGLVSWLHLLVVWPLPVLLVFHILASYYF